MKGISLPSLEWEIPCFVPLLETRRAGPGRVDPLLLTLGRDWRGRRGSDTGRDTRSRTYARTATHSAPTVDRGACDALTSVHRGDLRRGRLWGRCHRGRPNTRSRADARALSYCAPAVRLLGAGSVLL